MTVCGNAQVAKRSGIGDQAIFIFAFEGAAEDEMPAVRKGLAHRKGCRSALSGLERKIGFMPQQPAGLVVEKACFAFERAVTEQDRCRRKQRSIWTEFCILCQPRGHAV